jgi:hypothetical protein
MPWCWGRNPGLCAARQALYHSTTFQAPSIFGLGIYIYFFQHWGLNSGPTSWATPPVLCFERSFWDRVLRTICPGWLQIVILMISASWVARDYRCEEPMPGLDWVLPPLFTDKAPGVQPDKPTCAQSQNSTSVRKSELTSFIVHAKHTPGE